MAEYREIRSKLSFLELCKNSPLCSEITVFAVQELDVDAGIIFADILLPLEAYGLGLRFVKGDGPVIDKPITSLSDVENLPPIAPAEQLSFVLDAIEIASSELGSIPLIGFAGAPFTLASYAIEGGSSRNHDRTRRFMHAEPRAWHMLMNRFSAMTAAYLAAQARAGASALQIFDSWVGCLSPSDYIEYVLPHMKNLLSSLRQELRNSALQSSGDKSEKEPDIPIIYFGTSTAGLLPVFAGLDVDVVGIDWRIDIENALELMDNRRVIQGNLDPVVLFADVDEIEKQAFDILRKGRLAPGHIFNLGHGVLPDTPVDNVKRLVRFVHEKSQELNSLEFENPRQHSQASPG